MDKEVLKKVALAGGRPAAMFASCAGFFCDFVKPMLNLVPYFFFISLLATFLVWRFVFTKKLRHSSLEEILSSHYGKAFGMAVISTGFWLIMIPIFAFTPEQGIAASLSPDIANFQGQVLGRLDRIENKIDQGFEKVLSKIDQIDTNAGLISDPKTSNDYYHNARIHELNGNLIEAKKSYEKYFEAGLSYLDPYLSYSLILKNLEGISTAREMMGKMREANYDNPALNLAYVLMKESREDKLALLTDLAQKYPEFGPVHYFLGEQYSFKEGGSATNAEKSSEREVFTKLLELEKDQKFSKYFVDKKLAEEKLNFVKQEMNMLEGMVGNMLDDPIEFNIEYVDNSISLSFVPTEMVQKIFYRIDGKGEFKDTGSMGVNMAGMDTPLPNYQVMEAITLGDHYVEMKYVDLKGKESPVYRHDFKIEPLKLQYPPHKFVNGKTGKDEYMIFWSTFDNSKYYDYYYSIDEKSLNKPVEDGDITLTDLNKGTHTIYLQGVAGSEKTNIAEMTFEVN